MTVCVLAALFLGQSVSASLQKSATFDEPMHMAAGLSYLETGRIVVSPDHPPLLKELSATALRLAGIRWPATAEAASVIERGVRFPQALARSIVVDNGPDRVLSARAPARVAGWTACAWLALASIGIYPDHLSYFNEAACALKAPSRLGIDGGSRCGPMWLDDSNVDWGQGLRQLKDWLDRNAPGREVRLGYFGTVPPAAYGIRETPMSDEDILHGSAPGLYAVSAHIIASTPAVAMQALGGGAEWLRHTRPIAIVGHAYYVFEIPDRRPSR